ncbi:ATP-binding protein [Magnetospirillum molischianum]|uniref:histidine kinase n=1 Tax=Magnetospirillum molischianum DSM 120 TaxID=1150626 RepID=H8FNX8_MAGML|nr:ATP-binding protein [Magnetospirillum molischianum]CCG40066.1 Putative two-component sensor histidine kinase, classical system [Magnetospirillum molischianum DSM 120]
MSSSRSLRSRLILGAALWLVLAMALGGWILGNAFSNAVEASFHERLRAHLRALAAVVEINSAGTVGVGRPVGEPRFDLPYSGWYWQVSDGETVRARSRSLWDFALPVSTPATEGVVLFRQDIGPRGEALETAERDLVFPGSERLLHLSVSASRQEVDNEVRGFNLLLTLALGGLGVGLIAAVALQVGYGLRPLGQLALALDNLRQRGGRLHGHYPREVAPLVAAVNEVLDHDERMIARARTHVGNLAHGLKTPLAVIEAELGASQPDRAVLSGQIARVNRLIDVHLSRARAEAAPSGSLAARVAVAEVAAEIKAALVRIHAGRDLSIELECAADALAPIARDDLAEILGNLMDNACKWTTRRVKVTATATSLTVEDDGRGLSPEESEIATQRGARLDESAPGSGLGLAIVADLAALSGLELGFGRSDWGGLKVTLSWADRRRNGSRS